ncbi:hypothetical protein AVEN_72898-1 [Araneus ventricosus]|uniref:Uncharacterized protein n=1 Tax=Araneus ventricosus TaxID=182803 RepID=A0A4Y2KLA9_ARAVE|nr:hypothetical protein AVEN_72898-1 [Araneus ventricosus]
MRRQPKEFYAAGIWALIKRWDKCVNIVRRKGVDGFSVVTPGLLTDPVPISLSSDSLTDDWAPTEHKPNFAITKLLVEYVMHNSFSY